MVTPDCCAEYPAVQPCIAACWALEPAPLRVPLSCLALVLAAEPLLPLLLFSFEAPHAASAREPASAATTRGTLTPVTERVLLLSIKSMPLEMARTSVPGRRQRA